jgi:hypothetical protein
MATKKSWRATSWPAYWRLSISMTDNLREELSTLTTALRRAVVRKKSRFLPGKTVSSPLVEKTSLPKRRRNQHESLRRPLQRKQRFMPPRDPRSSTISSMTPHGPTPNAWPISETTSAIANDAPWDRRGSSWPSASGTPRPAFFLSGKALVTPKTARASLSSDRRDNYWTRSSRPRTCPETRYGTVMEMGLHRQHG